jgi:hypothetical protein
MKMDSTLYLILEGNTFTVAPAPWAQPSMKASQLRINLWALLTIFLLVGLGVLAAGVRVWLLARQSIAWPVVNGQIVSIHETNSSSKGGSVRGVRVVYDYIFDGKLHHGRRIAFGFESKRSREQLGQMRAGDSVMVSVDPRDGSRSVMFPGVTAATRIPAFIGVGVLGFTALVAFLIFRNPPWELA